MKVLGLIEKDLDVVSKEYVDNKIKNFLFIILSSLFLYLLVT